MDFNDHSTRKLFTGFQLDMPFDEFEKDVIKVVRLEENHRRPELNNLRLSWFFYFLGLLTGIVVTVILFDPENSIFGDTTEKFFLPSVLLFSVISLIFLEKLLRVSFMSKPA